jgi:hypothetical protein
VLSFAGRWLPQGEALKREGELVIHVRETLGWKFETKPSKGGSAACRRVGLLVREHFIDTELHDEPPFAPGLGAAWQMQERR